MFIKVLKFVAVVLIVFIAIVLGKPNEFRVERSAVIPAPAAAVFAQVNDMHNWQTWSPWAKLDPNAKNTFSGPSAGVGAGFSWSGNDKVGEGKMTVIESLPNELVKFKLEFLKPFTATNTSEFTFKSQGNETLVTWSMYGPNSFMGKAMSLFMNCDQMVGSQFEQGFANLKAIFSSKL